MNTYTLVCFRTFAVFKREITFHRCAYTYAIGSHCTVPIGFSFHSFTVCLLFRKQKKQRRKWNEIIMIAIVLEQLGTTKRSMQKNDEAHWDLDQQFKRNSKRRAATTRSEGFNAPLLPWACQLHGFCSVVLRFTRKTPRTALNVKDARKHTHKTARNNNHQSY